jgi:hypothetical protein
MHALMSLQSLRSCCWLRQLAVVGARVEGHDFCGIAVGQLYAGGEPLGGCDVVLELDAEGKLKETIQDALKEVDNAGGLVPGGTHATSLTALEDAAASRGAPCHPLLPPSTVLQRFIFPQSSHAIGTATRVPATHADALVSTPPRRADTGHGD